VATTKFRNTVKQVIQKSSSDRPASKTGSGSTLGASLSKDAREIIRQLNDAYKVLVQDLPEDTGVNALEIGLGGSTIYTDHAAAVGSHEVYWDDQEVRKKTIKESFDQLLDEIAEVEGAQATITSIVESLEYGQTTVSTSDRQDDLSLADYTDIRFDTPGSMIVTGVLAEDPGTTKTLRNVGDYLVVLMLESSSSQETSRFMTESQTGSHVVLFPGDVAELVYDGQDTRWTVKSRCSVWDTNEGTLLMWVPVSTEVDEFDNLYEAVPTAGLTVHEVRAPAAGSYINSRYRHYVASSGVAASVIAVSATNVLRLYLMPSNGSGLGGFACRYSVGLEDAPDLLSGAFFGPSVSTTAGVGIQYSNLDDVVGFGFDANDANMHFAHNDTSGAATRVDLGSDFARQEGSYFRFYLYWSPNDASRVSYVAVREDDLTVQPAVGEGVTNLPSTAMGFVYLENNFSSSEVQGFSFDEVMMWIP
jgi:hypothetical protein